jgi:hypothetical protein
LVAGEGFGRVLCSEFEVEMPGAASGCSGAVPAGLLLRISSQTHGDLWVGARRWLSLSIRHLGAGVCCEDLLLLLSPWPAVAARKGSAEVFWHFSAPFPGRPGRGRGGALSRGADLFLLDDVDALWPLVSPCLLPPSQWLRLVPEAA